MWRDTRLPGPIRDAIESGAAAAYNKDDCVWRRGNDRDVCPDPDIHIYLYTPGRPRRLLDPSQQSDWLRQDYEPTKDNVILIHGYAGRPWHCLNQSIYAERHAIYYIERNIRNKLTLKGEFIRKHE